MASNGDRFIVSYTTTPSPLSPIQLYEVSCISCTVRSITCSKSSKAISVHFSKDVRTSDSLVLPDLAFQCYMYGRASGRDKATHVIVPRRLYSTASLLACLCYIHARAQTINLCLLLRNWLLKVQL